MVARITKENVKFYRLAVITGFHVGMVSFSSYSLSVFRYCHNEAVCDGKMVDIRTGKKCKVDEMDRKAVSNIRCLLCRQVSALVQPILIAMVLNS